MKKFYQILFALLLFPVFLSAQHLEFGVIGGLSSYLGDLTPDKSRLSMGDINRSGGIFVRSNRNEYFSIKLGLNYGQVSASDWESNNASRRNRNLHFISQIWEGNISLEYNILGFEPKYMTRRFSPYVFVGVGYFSFNPRSYIPGTGGQLVDLQPLRTEGQGLPGATHATPYKTRAFSFPMGAGVKFALTSNITIGGEIGLRGTTTDYLDDVSATYISDDIIAENYGELSALMANKTGKATHPGQRRGNPHNNDFYVMGGLTLSYHMVDGGRNRFKRKRPMGCPTF